MNELATLAQIVALRRRLTLPVIDLDQTVGNRKSQLFDLLLTGAAPTQVQAAGCCINWRSGTELIQF